MVLLENIKHRIKNIPGYLRAKVKGKPFHWTMTRKQMENKKRSFESKIPVKQPFPNTNNLTFKNANVNEVNLNKPFNTTPSLELPLKPNPIREANGMLMDASTILDTINETMMRLPMNIRPHIQRVKRIRENQPAILTQISEGKRLAEQAIAKAQTASEKPNSEEIIESSEELLETFKTIENELKAATTYTKGHARQNLRNGIFALKQNDYQNLSNAYNALRSSPENLQLIANYGVALEQFQKKATAARRNRVARAMGPPYTVGRRYGRGGNATRKLRKH